MSLKLPNFFKSKGYLNNTALYRISATDLSTARQALKVDIDAFFLNGMITLASSIHSLNKNNYSWSFIQLYYSIFYFARTFNGINDFAIVYKNKKPLGIKIQPSEGFTKLAGNTHDVVLNQFKTQFQTDTLLSTRIEDLSPVDWFNKSRNFINYALTPQTDPTPPINLYQYKNDLRKWIVTYLNDNDHIYTFDPSHCYLAYPLQLLNRLHRHYVENDFKNDFLNEDIINHLKDNIADNKGVLSPIMLKINDLVP